MEIIATHINADFDSLAAMVAAKKIYTRARVVLSGSQNKNVREFIFLHKDLIGFLEAREVQKEKVKRLIMVDTRIAERLGELQDIALKKDIEIIVYDHHPPTKDDIKAHNDFSQLVGATTTILVGIIREKKIEISPFEATLFALGIYEDTGSLTYPTTTSSDIEALAYLKEKGADLKIIHKFLDRPLDEIQHRLLDKLLHSIEVIDISGNKVMFAQAKVSEYVDSASALAYKIGDLENADAVFMLLSEEGRIYIIARSRVEEIRVDEILLEWGGGGHPQAASAVVKGVNLRKLKNSLVQTLKKSAASPHLVKEAKIKKVRVLSPHNSVREAQRLMKRYKCDGLPVEIDGKLVGMITKEGAEKATLHSLSHAPVKGFMVGKTYSLSLDDTLQHAEELMISSGLGALPVVRDGKVEGIITREALLETYYGTEYLGKEVHKKEGFSKREIVKEIRRQLPSELVVILEELGKIAEREKMDVYLVGGFVRDLLLERPNFDVDLVVEGDGIKYARSVAEKLGGEVVAHKIFGTAELTLPSGYKIDIATARTEKYERPAALPKVRFSPIHKDLFRRDFTINAMAIALNTSKFGHLIDFFGGAYDLKKGYIRVLHKKSFIEDPTRIFRAVRFEQRYGFKIEPETEKLAKEACKLGMIKELTYVRIKDELILILEEEKAWHALKRLDDFGILSLLHKKLKADAELKNLLAKIYESLPQVKPYVKVKPRRWLISLIALLRNFSADEITAWANLMKFRKKDVKVLIEGAIHSKEVAKKLNSRHKIKNSELYYLLNEFSPEALVYLLATSEKLGRQRIHFFLATLKKVKLYLNGNDLIKMGLTPSPAVGAVLKDLLDAKLDGKIKTKADEEKFAYEEIKSLRNFMTYEEEK